MKSSRWKRYDARSGLWISSSKSIYLYWFRFLQHAENDPDREVDWSLYEGWGGAGVILDTKFDAWWRKNWKTLFGYKKGETEPRYSLSTTKPQLEGIRYSLLVYEKKHVRDYWEIAKSIAKVEWSRKKRKQDPTDKPEDWSFYIARPFTEEEMRKSNPTGFRAEFSKQKRTLQSRVGRYMSSAEKHLDNVCEGRFP